MLKYGKHHWSQVALVAGSLMIASDAHSEVTVASRGWLASTVTVHGKARNATIDVEQSDVRGGNRYNQTGYAIETDRFGNGSVVIPNIFSGTLLVGHNVRVGTNTRRVGNGWGLFASLTPGYQDGSFTAGQMLADGSNRMTETWNAGAVWMFSLDPSEGSWSDEGASISTDGDLVAELVSVDSQTISVRILSDPTPTSNDSIHFSGIGLTVADGVSVMTPKVALIGTSDYYVNDERIGSITSSSANFVATMPVSVVPSPGVMALLGSGALMVVHRRRRNLQ